MLYEIHDIIVGQWRIFGGVMVYFLPIGVIANHSKGIERGENPLVGSPVDGYQWAIGKIGDIRFQCPCLKVIKENSFPSGGNQYFLIIQRNHFLNSIFGGVYFGAFRLEVCPLFQLLGLVIVEIENIFSTEQDASFNAE